MQDTYQMAMAPPDVPSLEIGTVEPSAINDVMGGSAYRSGGSLRPESQSNVSSVAVDPGIASHFANRHTSQYSNQYSISK